jgi:glyoxylase-like metal-dependent hydrolase (beta-lactamase superfamily II)
VRFVLPSHHDFDHAGGAAVFNDTAEIVGHAAFNDALAAGRTSIPAFTVELDRNKNGRLEKAELGASPFGEFLASYDRNGDGAITSAEFYADVIPVESTFTSRRTVTLGGKSVELVHPGPAHAKDMAVLLFPAERVVFAVDYLPIKSLPFFFVPSTPRELIASVRFVETLDFDTIAPGHGEMGTKGDVTAFRQYVEELLAGVEEGIKAGRTVEQLQASNMLEKYKSWANYGMQRNANIAEVYALVKGAAAR